jgi:cytosine/adenosine deaminase-related metal-dependent hydrolase
MESNQRGGADLEQDPAPRTLISGGVIPSTAPGGVVRCDLAVRGGRIEEVSHQALQPTGQDRVVDVTGHLVLPGFVNAHTHSYATVSRHVATGLPLEPWMMHAWANTIGRRKDEVHLAASVQALEALKTGTTCVLDHLGGSVDTMSGALEAYDATGIRAFFAPMISDIPLTRTVGLGPRQWPSDARHDAPELTPPGAVELMEATADLHRQRRHRPDRVRVMLGPSAPQRCSTTLLEACAEMSSELDLPVHTHLLESRAQAVMAPPDGAASWSEHLDRVGLLTHRLSVAHAVWATADDLARLAAAGATIVHNPQSNLQLGSGIGQLATWRRFGINVALGTDGANCGGSLDMVSSMRMAAILHRSGVADPPDWETPRSVLQMATSAGATALGLEGGGLTPGSPADLCTFDLSGSAYASGEDPLAGLVLSSYDHRASTVLVAGEVVVRDGRVLTVDEESILDEARAVHTFLMRRNAPYAAIAEAQTPALTGLAAQAGPPRPIVEFVPTTLDRRSER